jgi:endonuclease III
VADDSRRLARVLDGLEKLYGRVRARRAADPYELLVLAQCGYPASDIAYAKGFAALKESVGISLEAILRAPKARLVAAMRQGGIVPEVRAERLEEIATVVLEEFGGDLDALKKMPLPAARKLLKRFPTIGDPGADKILLLSHAAPIAAVPSNATQVPLRLGFGDEKASYAASYRSAQEAIDAALPQSFEARVRAYVLLRRHGEEVCRRSRPECERCPVTAQCAYFAARSPPRGPATVRGARSSRGRSAKGPSPAR